MTSACAHLSGNVQQMHGSLVRINTDYLTQIADTLHQMQLEAANDDGRSQINILILYPSIFG